MASYSSESDLGRSRADYFRRAGFPADGGYGAKWVELRAGKVTLAFPNTPARVRAVKLHDIHHVLTEYETTWAGEGEIGAWEIASGCGRHYPAWILNFGALAIGLLIAPRRAFRAFVRGRHSRNLYQTTFTDDLLMRRVGELRTELSIPDGPVVSLPADIANFVAWAASAAAITLLPPAAIATIAVLAARRWLG